MYLRECSFRREVVKVTKMAIPISPKIQYSCSESSAAIIFSIKFAIMKGMVTLRPYSNTLRVMARKISVFTSLKRLVASCWSCIA